MGRFCGNCGRPLQDGEICNCTFRKEEDKIQNNLQELEKPFIKSQIYENQIIRENIKIPTLLVPIGQTVIGGILVAMGVITGTYDWSFISYAAGAGFLLTGICGIIEVKKRKYD